LDICDRDIYSKGIVRETEKGCRELQG
jgi:hypothetical protein